MTRQEAQELLQVLYDRNASDKDWSLAYQRLYELLQVLML